MVFFDRQRLQFADPQPCVGQHEQRRYSVEVPIVDTKIDKSFFLFLGQWSTLFRFVVRQFNFSHRRFKIVILCGNVEDGIEHLLNLLRRPVLVLRNQAEEVVLHVFSGDFVDMYFSQVGDNFPFHQRFVALVGGFLNRRFLFVQPAKCVIFK